MTFRQHETFVKQLVWFSALLIALTLFLCVWSGTVSVPLSVCSVLITLVAVRVWRAEPIITVDERGILCGAVERPMWEFSWGEIAELQRISLLRSAAVQIVPVTEHSPQNMEFYCFQLSRKAKIALEKYCPGYRK